MKRFFLSLALLSGSMSTIAAPLPKSTQTLTCEAAIPTGNGTTLIYQISGPLDLDDAGQRFSAGEATPSRSTEADSKLKMTVKKRDRFPTWPLR